MPKRGSIMAELEGLNLNNYKQLIEYPCRIIYKIDFDSVIILTILGVKRNLSEIINARRIQSWIKLSDRISHKIQIEVLIMKFFSIVIAILLLIPINISTNEVAFYAAGINYFQFLRMKL